MPGLQSEEEGWRGGGEGEGGRKRKASLPLLRSLTAFIQTTYRPLPLLLRKFLCLQTSDMWASFWGLSAGEQTNKAV